MQPPTFVNGFSVVDGIAKMPYQCLGRTGLQISKLSIGSGPFGGENFYGSYETEEAEETVITAIREGINFVDSGPHYGLGAAEKFLGRVLRRVPRVAYYISTKVGRIGNNFNFSAAAVAESFQNSLKRLQLDYVDIVFVHDVEFADSIDVIVDETLPQMKKFVTSGKARFIGISGYPLETLLQVVERSKIDIDCVFSYCRDTLIDDTLQKYIPSFEAKGVGVINAGCVGMRLLTNYGPPNWHPATEDTKNLCKATAEYCKEKGIELGNLALYHSLNQPGSCTHVVGINDLATLRSNLNIVHYGIDEQEEEALEHVRKQFFPPGTKLHWEGIEIARHRENKFSNY